MTELLKNPSRFTRVCTLCGGHVDMRGINVYNWPTVAVFTCTAGSTAKVAAVRVFLEQGFL